MTLNLDALVKQGAYPWAPSPDARDLVVWHEYDVPTAGLFNVAGTTVLFTIWGAPDERLTVWVYRYLTAHEVQELTHVDIRSVGDLSRMVDSRFAGRPAVFAIADNLRIWRWNSLDVKPGRIGLARTVTEFLGLVRESLESQKGPDAEARVKLAGIEAAKDELVST